MDDDAQDGEFEEINSDIENTDELQEWLSTKPTGHMTHILPQQTLIRKYLPPGTVSDLYEHYKSTQQMLGDTLLRSSTMMESFSVKNSFNLQKVVVYQIKDGRLSMYMIFVE